VGGIRGLYGDFATNFCHCGGGNVGTLIFECPTLGENNNKKFNFHKNVKSECLLTVQRTKIMFSSTSSNPVELLASPNTGGFAGKKIPHWWEIQEL